MADVEYESDGVNEDIALGPQPGASKEDLAAALSAAAKDGPEANLRRYLGFLGLADGEWFELQTLDGKNRLEVPGNGSAFVNTIDSAIRLLLHGDREFNAQGIYILPNVIDPRITARTTPNTWRAVQKGEGTKDNEILRRRAFYVDVDSKRPSGISASKEELGDALQTAVRVYQSLAYFLGDDHALGLGMSGNGFQIQVALNDTVAADDATEKLVKAILEGIASKYSTDTTVIDTSVSEAKRLAPAFGTVKRKGAHTTDRPHRRTLFVCPHDLRRLGIADLKAIASMFQSRTTASTGNKSAKIPNDEGVLKRLNETPVRDVAAQLGVDVESPTCPSCGAGGGGSDVAFLADSNRLKCLHNTCGARSWSPIDLVAKIAFGCDDLRGTKGVLKHVVQWFSDRMGIRIGIRNNPPPSPINFTQNSEPAADATLRPLTDLGNAERLIDRHGENLRIIPLWKKWMVWDGSRWAPDDLNRVVTLAEETVRSIDNEANAEADPDLKRAIHQWAVKSEAKGRIKAMIELAEALPGVPILPSQLDADPWLLNCPNGTVDLRAGALRPPRREDLITKSTAVDFDPNAKCPRYDQFLGEVQPDPEVRRFLDQLDGYSLTGVIREHIFVQHFGGGRNGKGTKCETKLRILADYACKIPAESLTLRATKSAHPTERATFFGRRFALASETGTNATLDVALVNELTGGDSISCRRMNEDFWSYRPTHHLEVMTNHKFQVRETSTGVWTRMALVPWLANYSDPAKADTDLPNKLFQEGSGILARYVRGCLDWQAHGLVRPKVVIEASKQYRDSEDMIGQFLDECCELATDYKVTAKLLYSTFKQWAADNSEWNMSQTRFGKMLTERGIEKYTSNGTWYRDIRVKIQNADHGVTAEELDDALAAQKATKALDPPSSTTSYVSTAPTFDDEEISDEAARRIGFGYDEHDDDATFN